MSMAGQQSYEETAIGWIPHGWTVTTLEAVCDGALRTGPFGSQLHAAEYQDEGVPVLMPKDLINGRANLRTAAKIEPARAEELSKHKLMVGDLLFSRRGDVARFALIDEASAGALCGTGCLKAKPSAKHSASFLAHRLQLDSVRTWLEQNAVGQTMPNMNTAILSGLPLVMPDSKAEQEEIADLLGSVDDKLNVIARQISATQTLKQGLMQTIFTRGAGTPDAQGRWCPHTAFQDTELGRIPMGWSVCELNDVVVNLDKLRVPLKQEDRASRKGVYPYYGASGVIDWIDDYLYDGDFILLGEDGENVLSRNLPLAYRATGKIWVNNHAHVFQAKEGVDIQFLTELLESLDYGHLASGTAQPKITQQALNQLRLPMPTHREQQKIGEVLSELQAKLAALTTKHTHYQTLKRGLMQKLLTGEWRVKVDASLVNS